LRRGRLLVTIKREVRMAKADTITLALPEDTAALIRDAVDSGDYASVDEVVRDALRDWKLKRWLAQNELADMRRFVQEGVESGPGIDADLVFARLRAKYAARAEE
jgi:antitoxin ParD1/3/4